MTTKRRRDKVHDPIYCVCGCSFFSHDNPDPYDNLKWHLGPCLECHNCPRHTSIEQWLDPLASNIEEYNEL